MEDPNDLEFLLEGPVEDRVLPHRSTPKSGREILPGASGFWMIEEGVAGVPDPIGHRVRPCEAVLRSQRAGRQISPAPGANVRVPASAVAPEISSVPPGPSTVISSSKKLTSTVSPLLSSHTGGT